MPLPPDFDQTLEKVQRLGIAAEEPGKIRDHLVLAIRSTGEKSVSSGDLSVGDLGFIEWSTDTLRKCEEAIHLEICDPAQGGLKAKYNDILESATGDEKTKQIATLVTNVLVLVNPSLAVSSVVVYFALWLAKVGLNYWCKKPL